MTRRVVIRLLIGGVAAISAGFVLAATSLQLGSDSGMYVLEGARITGLRVVPAGWAVVGISAAAATTLVVGVLSLATGLFLGVAGSLGERRH